MKRTKQLRLIGLIVALLMVTLIFGIRHDQRRPNQHMDQFWAIRNLSVWSFFGTEFYAKSELAVYDMTGKVTSDLPLPINTPEVQVRRFGKIIDGGSQFNLGENNYDRVGCLDYIYWALGSSSNAAHRIEATRVFYRSVEQYPLTTTLKDDLIADPSEAVRGQMQTILAHTN